MGEETGNHHFEIGHGNLQIIKKRNLTKAIIADVLKNFISTWFTWTRKRSGEEKGYFNSWSENYCRCLNVWFDWKFLPVRVRVLNSRVQFLAKRFTDLLKERRNRTFSKYHQTGTWTKIFPSKKEKKCHGISLWEMLLTEPPPSKMFCAGYF